MQVRLIKKLAACVNGLNIDGVAVGDVMSLPDRTALMMLAEGWAERVRVEPMKVASSPATPIVKSRLR
jgi:hypothetical protein